MGVDCSREEHHGGHEWKTVDAMMGGPCIKTSRENFAKFFANIYPRRSHALQWGTLWSHDPVLLEYSHSLLNWKIANTLFSVF
jgi:hypothetical protein